MAFKSAFLTLLLLQTGQLDWPVGLSGDGIDVSFYAMPECTYPPAGSRIESQGELAPLAGELCKGAPLPPIDLTNAGGQAR